MRLVSQVTTNAARYRSMIIKFCMPNLHEIDVDSMWFQRDGATRHTVRETILSLHKPFPSLVVSRFDGPNWSPRSCNLALLAFFRQQAHDHPRLVEG